jgi:hypothetical protein
MWTIDLSTGKKATMYTLIHASMLPVHSYIPITLCNLGI